uniref:Serine/threonine protein kinase n=1 Tax=Streptomyces auratus AGR0001 TaxID=1160718 RepID=J2K006_9ACTN
MDEYAGRVLAERYRLPLRPLGEDEFAETRAFDTFSGQEVLLRQVPLPEVVDAEVVGAETAGPAEGYGGGRPGGGRAPGASAADRSPRDPAARRALEAATTAAQLADHPRLEQVFDVFVQDGSLWVVAELLTARPLSALLAERALSPHRAAEIAADLLTALRVLHADGWLHRNITARTVLVCDDGRAILTGLAAGAAQEALCGDQAPAAAGTPRAAAAPEGAGERGTAPGGAAAEGSVTGGAKTSLVKDAPEEPPAADGTGTTTATAFGRPSAGLAAERARQARLTVVGPVTERWAPEQAGPVHEKWQLAPPVGPATDLWAVGALLYRCVQGEPPFPEDNAVELAQLVCSRPPAVAEECGALRPVVESLLRQDPADRPDFEELSGWLRSLIRTAPEPVAESRLVTLPAPERDGDPRRLPIVRRRGELVRKGRHKKTRTSRAVRPAGAPSDRAGTGAVRSGRPRPPSAPSPEAAQAAPRAQAGPARQAVRAAGPDRDAGGRAVRPGARGLERPGRRTVVAAAGPRPAPARKAAARRGPAAPRRGGRLCAGVSAGLRPGLQGRRARRAPAGHRECGSRRQPVRRRRRRPGRQYGRAADHRARGRRQGLRGTYRPGGFPGRGPQGLAAARGQRTGPGAVRRRGLRAGGGARPGHHGALRHGPDGVSAEQGSRAGAVPLLGLGLGLRPPADRRREDGDGRGHLLLARRQRPRGVRTQPRDDPQRALPPRPGDRPGQRTA